MTYSPRMNHQQTKSLQDAIIKAVTEPVKNELEEQQTQAEQETPASEQKTEE